MYWRLEVGVRWMVVTAAGRYQLLAVCTVLCTYSSEGMGWACGARGCIGCWWGSRRERDHWGGLGVDECIILGWISRR